MHGLPVLLLVLLPPAPLGKVDADTGCGGTGLRRLPAVGDIAQDKRRDRRQGGGDRGGKRTTVTISGGYMDTSCGECQGDAGRVDRRRDCKADRLAKSAEILW